LILLCFFFQAEDGIRYRNVTGVQTCALPISVAKVRESTTFVTIRRASLRFEICKDFLNAFFDASDPSTATIILLYSSSSTAYLPFLKDNSILVHTSIIHYKRYYLVKECR